MAFEDLLSVVSDEAERTTLAGIAAKYPVFKTTVEHGQLVEPVLSKLAELNITDPAAEFKDLPEWVGYRRDNWLPDRRMYRSEAVALEKAEQAERELNELRAKGVEGMTTEELDAYLATKGIVTKQDLDAVKSNVVTKEALFGAMDSQGRRFQEIYAKLSPKQTEYRNRYGEEIPINDIFNYMETKKVYNAQTKSFDMPTIDDAYTAVVTPKEAELKEKLHVKEVEAARLEGIQKGIEQASMSRSGAGVPVSGGGSMRAAASNFMQKIMQRRNERPNAGNERLGSGAAAQAGLADHLKRVANSGSV